MFHILCPECGEDLSEISLAYLRCKEEFYKKEIVGKHKVHIDKVIFKNDNKSDPAFILHALGINKMCCVVHCMGATSFDTDL